MTEQEIASILQAILQDVLDDNTLIITADTRLEELDTWDSLAQILVTASIEKRFGIRFAFEDLPKLNDIGAMIEIIQHHLGSN